MGLMIAAHRDYNIIRESRYFTRPNLPAPTLSGFNVSPFYLRYEDYNPIKNTNSFVNRSIRYGPSLDISLDVKIMI